MVKGICILRWQVQDDNGQTQTFLIRDTLYVPDMPHCLLSPQYWAQQSNDDSPRKHGTWCATYADTCQLYWKQNKYTKTVPFDHSTNTPKFMSAPNNKSFKTEVRLLETESKSNTAESTVSFCSEIRSKPEGRQQHDDEFLADFIPY